MFDDGSLLNGPTFGGALLLVVVHFALLPNRLHGQRNNSDSIRGRQSNSSQPKVEGETGSSYAAGTLLQGDYRMDMLTTLIVGSVAIVLCLIIALTGIVWLLKRRRLRKRQRITDSIYSVPERWDSLSMNFVDNPNAFWKSSMDDLADDGYLARLDKEIARRMAFAHAYRNPMVNSCELRLDRLG